MRVDDRQPDAASFGVSASNSTWAIRVPDYVVYTNPTTAALHVTIPGMDASEVALYGQQWDQGSTLKAWRNGSESSANSTGRSLRWGGYGITLRLQHHPFSNASCGRHGGVPLFNRLLTDAERELLEGYLAHKWGMADNLPAAHPYKSAYSLSGNATIAAGDAVERVVVSYWDTMQQAASVAPDANGDWTVDFVLPDDYAITYTSTGCQPITHGPYTVNPPT